MNTTNMNTLERQRLCIDDGELIVLNGWTIRRTTEPWALKYGYGWETFNDEQIHLFETLEECIDFINEK